MLKRYTLTFLACILLLLCYGTTLTPLLIAGAGFSTESSITAALIWALLVLLSLGPALSMIIRKIWFFKGEGEPVPLEALRTALLMLNKGKGPLLVTEKRKGLVITWNYKDPKWCRLMDRREINRLHELHLVFNNATKTVELSDKSRSLQIMICSEKIKTGLLRKPALLLGVKIGDRICIDSYTTTSELEYAFHPREIKSPVMGSILQSGWNVRFHLF